MDPKELEMGAQAPKADLISVKTNADPGSDKTHDNQSDDDIIKEARDRCDDSESECYQIFEDIKKNLAFVNNLDNGQWDETLYTARINNPGGPLPCLTVNKLQVFANRLANDARMQRPGVKLIARNDGINKKTVEIAQGLLRSIVLNGDSESAYDTALDNACTAGLGYYQIKTRYVDDDSFDQEIYLDRILNPLDVIFPIHLSKEIDFSDCDYCFVVKDISKDQYREQFGEWNDSDWDVTKQSKWVTDKCVRLVMYYRKKYTNVKIYKLEDGSVVEQLPEGMTAVKTRTKKKITVEWYQLSAHMIHSRGIIPGEYLPIIPCVGKEALDKNNKRRFKSLCQDAQDAQRMLNYQKSSIAQYYALAPKARWMAARGQVEAYQSEYEQANTSNIVILHYDPILDKNGVLLPQPQPIQQNQVATAMVSEVQMAQSDIKEIVGLPDVKLGNSKGERSGKAIKANQREGELINYHFADNQRKSMVAGWSVICSMIPTIYDTERVVQIVNGTMEQEQVKINQEVPNEQTGQIDFHDMTKLKLQVTAETGPSYSSRREQTSEFLLDLIQAVPTISGGLLDLLADAIGADQAIVDRCKLLLPPQLQQQVAQKDIPPAVRAIMAQMEKGIQQADALIKQKDTIIQQLVTAVKDKTAERNAKLQTTLIKAEAEIQKAKISMAHDVGKAHLEHHFKMEEMAPAPTAGNDNIAPVQLAGEGQEPVPAQ